MYSHNGSLLHSLHAHNARIEGIHSVGATCVAFSTDGGQLVSGGVDGYARVWNVASGQCVRAYDFMSRRITGLCLSTTNKLAVSMKDDNHIDVLQLDSMRLIKTIKVWHPGAPVFASPIASQRSEELFFRQFSDVDHPPLSRILI